MARKASHQGAPRLRFGLIKAAMTYLLRELRIVSALMAPTASHMRIVRKRTLLGQNLRECGPNFRVRRQSIDAFFECSRVRRDAGR
jgi:hypothetical protein